MGPAYYGCCIYLPVFNSELRDCALSVDIVFLAHFADAVVHRLIHRDRVFVFNTVQHLDPKPGHYVIAVLLAQLVSGKSVLRDLHQIRKRCVTAPQYRIKCVSECICRSFLLIHKQIN